MDLSLEPPKVLSPEVGMAMDVDYATPLLLRAYIEETSIKKVK
jgi:hypothetical protein